LNAVAIVDGQEKAIASTGFTVLRPRAQDLDSSYLFRWVQTPDFIYEMVRQATGASYPAVSDSIVKSSKIPLPPLEEQKRIAAILDKADAIRRKREQSIKLADEFLRSLFLDMFGDPVTNPKGWPISSLLSLSLIRSGVTKGRTLRGPVIEVPYMRVANVQDGHLNLSEIKTIPATQDEINRYSLSPGDVLLTEGGDPDKLGRGAVWHGEIPQCIHQNHVFCVRPDPQGILPDYLSALLASTLGKRYFLSAAKQTTGIATINKTQLSEFPVLVPGRDLQVSYCKAVDDLKAIKEHQEQLLEQATELVASLTCRAFRGEI
jgi:type I restriction enzyme S subunit